MTEKQRKYIEVLIDKLEKQISELDAEDIENAKESIDFDRKRIDFVKKNLEIQDASLLIDGLKNEYYFMWKIKEIILPQDYWWKV